MYVCQAPEKVLISLILSDLHVLDPYEEAWYRKVWKTLKQKEIFLCQILISFSFLYKIISQQSDDIVLFHYRKGHIKDVQVLFAKDTIVFLYK